MTCTVKRRSELAPGIWNGGTTTELFVFPAGTSYAARDFSVRASISTVELETSLFTDLPGYRRLIMPLAGGMRLVHEGQYAVELAPYEVETFDGGWHTRSFGQCTDCNLMLAAGWEGTLQPAGSGDTHACAPVTGLYALAETAVTVSGDGEPFTAALEAGDLLLVVAGGQNGRFEITSGGDGVLGVLFTAKENGGNK